MTNYVELLIGNPSFADLDLDSAFNIALQYSIADIKDISKRNSAYSKTIVLPGTKNNNYWLGNLFDVNADFSGFNPNKKTPAKLLVNSETVINGFLQLRKIKKLVNVDHQGNNIQYEVVIFDNAVDLMTELGEKGINELDFSRFEHLYNRTNIIDSWNHTWLDGYVYPMYGTRDKNNVYSVEEFFPAVFYKQVLDQTLREAGYGWTGSLATNPQFDKEIIAYMGEAQPKVSDAELQRRKFRAGISDVSQLVNLPTNFGFFQGTFAGQTGETYNTVNILDERMPFNDVTTSPNFDNGNTFDVVFNEWVADRNGKFAFDYSVSYNLRIFNDISDDIFTDFQSNALTFEHRLEYFENNQWFLWPDSVLSVNTTMPNNFAIFPINTIKTINVNGTKTTGEKQVYIGTKVRMRLIVIKNTGAFLDFASGSFGFNLTSLPFLVTIPNTPNNFLQINPFTGTISQGDVVDFSSVLSDKLKQKDIISDLIKRYNLYIQIDPDNPNLLIFDSRPDFYEGGVVLDWTAKKDYSSEDNIELLSELQFKTMLFTWKNDSDEDNSFYTQQTGDIYGQYKWTFDNDFVKGEKKIESPFSPTPLIRTAFGAIVPSINPEAPKGNPRVLYWGGLRPIGNWLFTQYVFTFGVPVPIPFPVTTGYPYAGHLDDPVNPNLDINFGTIKFPMYNGLQTMTNNNMFNQYWFNYVDQISDGRLVTSKFYLTEADIRFIKNNFNAKIFVLDSYYYVNKIKDYKPMENGVTEVELLKIKDGVRWKQIGSAVISYNPVDFILNPGVSVGNNGTNTGVGNINVGYDNNIGGNVIDTNGVETSIGNIVVGNKNQVIGGSVFGDENIVSQKSFVVGDNNFLQTSKSMVLLGDGNKVQQSGLVIDGFENIIDNPGGHIYKGNNNVINGDNISLISSFGITASVKDSLYLGNKTRVGVFDGRIDGVDIKFEDATKIFNGNLNSLDDVVADADSLINRDNLFWDENTNKWIVGKREFINYFDFSSGATTTLTQGVWAPLLMEAVIGFENSNFSFKNTGEIVWGGPLGPNGEIPLSNLGERIFKVELILSGSSGNNNEIHVAFYKNDSLWPCSEQSVVTSSGGKTTSLPTQCLVNVVVGDRLRVYIKNSTASTNFTLSNINVIVTEY